MSSRCKRSGGKFGGDHTTFIPAAAIAADVACSCQYVTTVSSGMIESPRTKSGKRRHLKIIDTNWGILLSATDGAAHQEVRVYTTNVPASKLHIARGVRNEQLTISFGNQIK